MQICGNKGYILSSEVISDNFKVRIESKVTVYYLSGKYVLCQLRGIKLINTRHLILKDKFKSKGCIPNLRKIHSMKCMDTLRAHLATEAA